jgi:hypothetical protein
MHLPSAPIAPGSIDAPRPFGVRRLDVAFVHAVGTYPNQRSAHQREGEVPAEPRRSAWRTYQGRPKPAISGHSPSSFILLPSSLRIGAWRVRRRFAQTAAKPGQKRPHGYAVLAPAPTLAPAPQSVSMSAQRLARLPESRGTRGPRLGCPRRLRKRQKPAKTGKTAPRIPDAWPFALDLCAHPGQIRPKAATAVTPRSLTPPPRVPVQANRPRPANPIQTPTSIP